MLKASEANHIANGWYEEAENRVMDYLEQSILARAKDGLKWFPWDYEFSMEENGLTAKGKQNIIFKLRSAGYDVKDHWIMKEVIIRW